MRSLLAVGIAALLAVVLQTTIRGLVPWLPIVPDFILVLTVYLGLNHHGAGGVVGAFLLGWLLDTFSGTVLGVNVLACMAVYVAVYLVSRMVWTQGWPSALAMTFIGGCVRQATLMATTTLVETPAPLWHHVLRYGLWEAGLAALVAPAVFAFIAWEERRLGGTRAGAA